MGALVQRERKRRRLTQTELGELVDVSQSTVWRIEAGTSCSDTFLVQQLARKLFDVTFLTLNNRIERIAELYRRAEEALAPPPTRIASRDAERSLIDYVVEVAA